jgi:hypothetical protein
VAAQPFSWPDYLTLANELSIRSEEYCLRTAISRTYYFVYHLARQRILDNGFPIEMAQKFATDLNQLERRLPVNLGIRA